MLKSQQPTKSEAALLKAALARSSEQFARNLNWFSEHAAELDVFNRYPGRHIAVAGGELFVGDSSEEVAGLALAKHPDEHPFIHNVQKVEPAPRAKKQYTITTRPMTPQEAKLFEDAQRNSDWFEAHALELDVFNRYRGKYLAIAGGEIFAADSASEALRLAHKKYPDEHPHRRYIPKTKARRIYAHQRRMENF